MMGSFLSRALLMVFGYAYPAYECFKAVEKKKKQKEPDIEQLLCWCQYWILVALLTVGERVGDAFIAWFPLYSEAKLGFFIYLWHPKTKGTVYIYNFILRPYVAKHEADIDRNLLKLKMKAREIGLLLWEEATGYGQTRLFQILHYLSSHTASVLVHDRQAEQKRPEQLLPNPSTALLSGQEVAQEVGHIPVSPCSESTATPSTTKVISDQAVSDDDEAAVAAVSSYENGCKQEAVPKEDIQHVRGKWRLFRTAASRKINPMFAHLFS